MLVRRVVVRKVRGGKGRKLRRRSRKSRKSNEAVLRFLVAGTLRPVGRRACEQVNVSVSSTAAKGRGREGANLIDREEKDENAGNVRE